jgi:hypothetical protein
VVISPFSNINVDIDGVTIVVDAFLDKVRNDSSFSDVRNNVGRGNRITHCKYDEIGYNLSFPTDIM